MGKGPLQASASRVLFISAFGFITLGLSACGRDQDQPRVTPIQPLSQAELNAIHFQNRYGTGVAPDQPLLPENFSLSTECAKFVSKLAPTFQHATISVPEDWSDPSSPKIQVFYYYRIQKNSDGSMKPAVVFFNGGPASDSHSSYSALESTTQAAGFSFVYIDQRGTGCSDPYPTVPTAENARRLTHYGSRGIVRDSEAIRQTLFGQNSKWKVFGQSYGGYIVHRYAQMAPEGVSAAYAHGSSLMKDSIAWIVARIRSQYRVSQEYFAQYPNDEKILGSLRAAIPANHCWDNGVSRVCGNAVLDATTIYLGFHDTWASLHQWINAFQLPGGAPNYKGLDTFVRALVFGEYANNGFAGTILSNLELAPGVGPDSGCGEVFKRLEAEGEKPLEWGINECRLLPAIKSSYDAIANSITQTDPILASDLLTTLDANPSERFFLYSGQKDVFVPVETFAEEIAAMGHRIKYMNFPNSGHEGFMTEQQVWNDLQSD